MTVTQADASAAVFGRWFLMWPGLSGGVPFVTDNVVAPEPQRFARVGIQSLDSEQHTIGPRHRRRYRRPGMIDVRINGPINEGRKPLDLLAGHVRAIFEGVRFGAAPGEEGITTFATSVKELRRDRDAPQLWLLQVVTPFEFYETN